jgi:(2S)-methylsuccinyl-CoA dehydrogenase
MSDAPATANEVLLALETLYTAARTAVRARVVDAATGKLSAKRLDEEQLAAHAVAYLATEIEASRQLLAWALRVEAEGGDSSYERRLADVYVAELARLVRGGVDLGQTETISLAEIGVGADVVAATIESGSVGAFVDATTRAAEYLAIASDARTRVTESAGRGLGDETLLAIQREFRKLSDKEVRPIAQDVHRRDVLIPMALIAKLSEAGVFGLTIPERYGGLGLGKVAMCIVTEELSRGYIGVGSLGTRSEIAAELIMGGGTEAQKDEWLPKLASGEVMSTAVFTEPNHGSDLAHIKTRGERADGGFKVYGQKTWITHACRADLMTLLLRTNAAEGGYAGLSMLLAKKTRTDGEAGREFTDAGLTGTEIKVLGYRGMKEYELSFDGFVVPESGLLGGVEGQGFKQLMATFESARIQTAARGVGIAQAAFEEAVKYAEQRVQFGRPIVEFPRVARKLARIACRTQAARQLTFYAARMKDSGRRCDLEAGMAKLLATRAAWEAADACVQIHGGNGFAEEYTASRLLVDARVLSIFEGANEIQAHVVARRLLEQ